MATISGDAINTKGVSKKKVPAQRERKIEKEGVLERKGEGDKVAENKLILLLDRSGDTLLLLVLARTFFSQKR